MGARFLYTLDAAVDAANRLLGVCAAGLMGLVMAMGLACATPAFAASYENGVYEVELSAFQATRDQASMCDGVLENPAKLTVGDSGAVLEFALKPVKMGTLKGYLGYIASFPGWEGPGLPDEADAVAARIVSTYEGVADGFNGEGGTDDLMKGVEYPKEVALDWDTDWDECYLQVYVPVMNSISAGSGWQYVRLRPYYDSMERVDDSQEGGEPDGGRREGGDSSGGGVGDGSGEGGGVAGSNSSSGLDVGGNGESDGDEKSGSNDTLSGGDAAAGTSSVDSRSGSSGNGGSSPSGKSESSTEGSSSGGSDSAGETSSGRSGQKSSSSSVKESTESGGSSGSEGQGGQSEDAGKAGQPLDFRNLEDGVYKVSGTLVKTDRKTPSMADAALDHVLTLNVKNGLYSVDAKLDKVTFAGQTSYLGSLNYFKTGYGVDGFGVPTGKTAACKVLSYHMQGEQRVSDNFGTDYPAEVRIPLVEEAVADGFVPLQAFVPVMESIAAGTGTQAMYLKLDTASVVEEGEQPKGDGSGAGAGKVSGENTAAQSGGGMNEQSAGDTGNAESGGSAQSGRSVIASNTLPSMNASVAAGVSPAPSTSGQTTLAHGGSSTLGVASRSSAAGVATSSSGSVSSTGQKARSASSASAQGVTTKVSTVRPVQSGASNGAAMNSVEAGEAQPPLKKAILPMAIAGVAVVALGVASVAFRRRDFLFDGER